MTTTGCASVTQTLVARIRGGTFPAKPETRPTPSAPAAGCGSAAQMLAEMEREERIEQTARQRILSMKRDVPEGSEEWDVLYSKYYREEQEKESKIR